ncbi:hypothetical protein Tco_1339837, partial [Tanacetum coccineum]
MVKLPWVRKEAFSFALGKERDNESVGVIFVATLIAWVGEASFDNISMTSVLASFLGGFLMDEEALEA